MTTFHNNRLLIFEAGAIGTLRQEILDELGWERARELLFRSGYKSGISDYTQLNASYQFDTEMDLIASGPVIHTWEGLVHAAPTELRYNRKSGDMYFAGVWTNSYEAEQYLAYNVPAKEPVCWSLTGYASGYATAFMGMPMLAMEPHCVGKGDNHCEWLIKPVNEWGDEAGAFASILQSASEEFCVTAPA